jgi:hypothetical protein
METKEPSDFSFTQREKGPFDDWVICSYLKRWQIIAENPSNLSS